MASYDHSKNNNYVVYNDKEEVFNLDKNVWHAYAGIIADGTTGRHLYKGEPRHPSYYICYPGRDKETHYLINIEKDSHPDHSSRFGYGRAPFGYGSGHWPGRYNTSSLCSDYDPQPPAMAPARFYTAPYQGPFQDRTQATVDYDYWKNYGMNFPPYGKYCDTS